MALPKDPRQLMINLMYLVLTAMLALNITKEVLTAFQTINTSIEGSITSINGKNNKFYDQFEALYNQPDKKDKVAPYRTKALLIKTEAQKMMAYLNSYKDTVIIRSGGYEKGDNGDSVMKGLDNIDVPTKLFVEQKKGADIRAKMEEFKTFLVSQVGATDQASMKKNIPIQLTDLPKNDENPTGDWSYGNFHNIPVVATVAMLSKFQNDVKNSESMVLENLLSQVGATDWKFDQVKAIATPKTSYALEGQEIEATIILAAYNSTMVTDMGPNVKVDQGVGTMKFKASGIGPHTMPVTIKVPKDGQLKTYTTDFNYTVGSQGASLQLDKMNVMYIGVPNPVTLSASGYNIEDVKFDMPGSEPKSDGKGHYSVEVSKEGKLEWTISGKDQATKAFKAISHGEIRVKSIPDPTGTIAGKFQGTMPTALAKAQEGVLAKVNGFDFETTFKVTSFRFILWPKSGDPATVEVTGNRFVGECATLIQRSKPGDRWVLENIKAVGPDKRIRSINGILLYLN